MVISLAIPHYLLLSQGCLPAKEAIGKQNTAEVLQNVLGFSS